MSRNISELIDIVDNVNFREFYWGSQLLKECEEFHDPRLIISLTLRHHSLSNKKADSAHVIRQTIKTMDGLEFGTLWNCIESETNLQNLIDKLDDYDYLPWAAAFILGEIGGIIILEQIDAKLRIGRKHLEYVLVRIVSHIVTRYIEVIEGINPIATVIDTNTGQTQEVNLSQYPDLYRMKKLRYSQENELFKPISNDLISRISEDLEQIPASVFNIPKDKLIAILRMIKSDIDKKFEKLDTSRQTIATKGPDGRISFHVGENANIDSFIKTFNDLVDKGDL